MHCIYVQLLFSEKGENEKTTHVLGPWREIQFTLTSLEERCEKVLKDPWSLLQKWPIFFLWQVLISLREAKL
jgi:hypothetical protein